MIECASDRQRFRPVEFVSATNWHGAAVQQSDQNQAVSFRPMSRRLENKDQSHCGIEYHQGEIYHEDSQHHTFEDSPKVTSTAILYCHRDVSGKLRTMGDGVEDQQCCPLAIFVKPTNVKQ